MTYRHLIALTAILTHTAHGALSAPMPAFKTASQLATWRAEMAAKPTSHGDSAEESAFFTGKPYIDASGAYAFKYRSYNPELARWTSEDPSGFPDGANSMLYVNNSVMNSYDPNGLWSEHVHSTLTVQWAKSIKFSTHDADIIGNACNGVDSGSTGPTKDASWHFNMATAWAPTETRMVHFDAEIASARAFKKAGKRDEALAALGRALHPLQDIYAHEQISPATHLSLATFGINPDDESDRPYRLTNTQTDTIARMREFLE